MIENYDSVPEIVKALIQSEESLSVRQLSRKLGYSSDRTVGTVLQGHREMGPDMQKRFADFAKLNASEREYLNLLIERQKRIRLGQSVDDVEQKLLEHKRKKNSASEE